MRLFTLSLLFVSIMNTTYSLATSKNEESPLYYLIREPKIQTDHPPLILLLHGVGSNEEDLFSFAGQLPDKYLVISARAPLSVGKDSYAWYQVDFSKGKPVFNQEQEEASKMTIIQFIRFLKKRYVFDDRQVYLCGFSQGAIMSYAVGLTNPELIQGIAAMSGRILDEVKPLTASNEKLKHLNVFISHGLNDGVLTIQYAREAAEFLKLLNLNPSYHEYPAGHTINDQMFRDLLNWLDTK